MYISNKLNGLIRNCFVVGAVFTVLSAFLVKSDVHYFFFSYLTSFSFFWTLTLGACFFVLIQHVTSAGWSVVVRRVPELFMANIWLMALLAIPVIFGIHDLYHWSHLSEVVKDHLLQIKQPFLNTPFFIVRLIIYFSVWGWIANKFFNGSVSCFVSCFACERKIADVFYRHSFEFLFYIFKKSCSLACSRWTK